MKPRSQTIRMQNIKEEIIDTSVFNVSEVGDCRAIVAVNSDNELFVEIYKHDNLQGYNVTRIIFDHETTYKIRRVFRGEHP